jgi:hypothetical protein
MKRLALFLMAATAATVLASAEASATWTCTAHSSYGSNHGWGANYDRGSAIRRALYECNARGGGCRITSCKTDEPSYRRRGYPCPSGWCD